MGRVFGGRGRRIKKKEGKEELKTIAQLMGIGLGVIGLQYDDFCRLTIEEFEECCKAWHKAEETRQRQEWERVRILATISVQPHSKKQLRPKQLLPFPWDNETTRSKETLTRAQRKARFDRLMKAQQNKD